MTTIVAVKKNGVAAIAADTLTSWGNLTESSRHVVNHHKIFRYADSYIGITGSSAFKVIFEHWLSREERRFTLNTVDTIFDTWLEFHHQLKAGYYLREFEREDDQFESSRVNILIANPYGIFAVTSLRAVIEYDTFTTFGSGAEVALGAMAALYDQPEQTAVSVAQRAIEIASEFDDGTGLPMRCYTVDLKR